VSREEVSLMEFTQDIRAALRKHPEIATMSTVDLHMEVFDSVGVLNKEQCAKLGAVVSILYTKVDK